jgi:hypothetical protein
MHLKNFLLTILSFLTIFLSFQLVFGAEKHAILIGINDYSLTKGFSNLNGPQNDIELMQKILKNNRFGFNHITVLLNEQATHSRIEKVFKQLADQAEKERIGSVYIYYSGHGSQTKDLNGDEKQFKDLNGNLIPSYDQTWVTYGSRLKKGVAPPQGFTAIDRYDLLDDQISAWIAKIAAGCDQVVFVSDSCHSGSVSRHGIAEGLRRGPIDRREHPLGKREYRQLDPKNVVRIGASKDTQIAREFIPKGSNKTYGVFTWYWVKALERCRPDDSWSHVFNRMTRIVYQETPNRQIPQISGAVAMKVFGADFLLPSNTISVYQVLKKGNENHVYLTAGSISGVTKGSIYTLEDKAGRSDAPEIVITEVYPTHSIAETTVGVKAYEQLIEISHHHRFIPMRILLKAEHEKDQGEALKVVRNIINRLEPYEIVKDEQVCDLIVYLFRPETSKSAIGTLKLDSKNEIVPPCSDEKADLQIWILDKNGFLYQKSLRHSYTKEGLVTLSSNLSRLARVRDFMQVESPEKKSPLELTVTPMVSMSISEDNCIDCVPNTMPNGSCPSKSYKKLEPLSLGEFLKKPWNLCTMIQFNAKNPTTSTYYFYVVYISNQAEIIPVFPSLEDQPEIAEIAPGSETVWGTASIRLDTKTLDHFKLIVCRKPVNHYLFFQSGVKPGFRGIGIEYKPNPLEKIIMEALSGKRNQVSYESGSWYAETIAIDMR